MHLKQQKNQISEMSRTTSLNTPGMRARPPPTSARLTNLVSLISIHLSNLPLRIPHCRHPGRLRRRQTVWIFFDARWYIFCIIQEPPHGFQ